MNTDEPVNQVVAFNWIKTVVVAEEVYWIDTELDFILAKKSIHVLNVVSSKTGLLLVVCIDLVVHGSGKLIGFKVDIGVAVDWSTNEVFRRNLGLRSFWLRVGTDNICSMFSALSSASSRRRQTAASDSAGVASR